VETLSVPSAPRSRTWARARRDHLDLPSDKVTKAFLKAQGREEAYVKLKADASAKYDRVIDIDLSALEPMVAMPHSPDNVKRVKEIAGKKVHQVLVGSCTNASYKDITSLARILKDRTVSPIVSFGVAPGSRQVLQMAAKESSIATLVGAGARILETACGFCIGAGQAPRRAASRSARTTGTSRAGPGRRTPGSSSSRRDGGGVRPEGRDGRPERRRGGARDRVPRGEGAEEVPHRRLDGPGPRGRGRRGRGPARAEHRETAGERPLPEAIRGSVTLKLATRSPRTTSCPPGRG